MDENDTTILPRLIEYGINYEIVDKIDSAFYSPKIETTITNTYFIK